MERERERERERETHTHRDRDRERQTDRQADKERQTERQTEYYGHIVQQLHAPDIKRQTGYKVFALGPADNVSRFV